ncbi:S8 family serine peptidase [Flavobacterium sp. 25HG05S-40]|uniref:S8 family serine peptidase n=1 Tax=Flavobacterium sp. 25HG05S-40 TaxID=3458682 RepID=UPI004043A03E
MKSLIVFLLFTICIHSQTVSERQKIVSSYNAAEITVLKNEADDFNRIQQKRVADYKKQHPFLESELLSLQRIEDDGTPIFYTTFNQGSSVTMGTNKMYPGGSLGLSVTGAGMTAGVWDGGKVRDTHQEFSGGKIILGDASATLSAHGTHVTGTIVASGFSASRRGIAYGAQARTYDWTSDYNEFLAFGAEGFLVSNHSYGYVASGLTEAKFGAYDTSSLQIDNVSNVSPYYQIVVAAGNDRDDFTVNQVNNKGGYDLLTGFGTSKNALVVAAVNGVTNYTNESSVVMSDFSNYGPTDDGRIKPDIAAKGVGVSSCTSNTNTSYDVFQGTSMAAPAIAGLVLMLQKHYNNLNATNYMRASTVRGLICHSAKEAGFYPGPDYEFGWGLANAELAANIITNRNSSTVLEENTLSTSQTFTKQISISSTQKLSVSICWTDPNGQVNISGDIDNRAPRLRNNLDLKVLKDGNIFYPWKLDPIDPATGATNFSDNDVDNIEKVEILGAEPGVYTIQVTHKGATLLGGSQVFSLIANATNGLSLNTRDYEYDNSVFVYPNPANNVLNFDVKNDITISSVSINDISGKEIYRATNSITNSIDISNLSSGVYFATFTSDNNSVTKKFIKE